jgi:hypothetical protein
VDVMIDLETMSIRPNAAVLTLAAVAFDPDFPSTVEELLRPEKHLYLHLALSDQRDRDIDPSTIMWWMQQSDEARKALLPPAESSPLRPLDAMIEFRNWYHGVSGLRLWSFGAVFDNVIVTDLFRQVGLINPTSHRNQLCARTVYYLAGIKPSDVVLPLTGHNALHDCIHQVICFQLAWRKLFSGSKV